MITAIIGGAVYVGLGLGVMVAIVDISTNVVTAVSGLF